MERCLAVCQARNDTDDIVRGGSHVSKTPPLSSGLIFYNVVVEKRIEPSLGSDSGDHPGVESDQIQLPWGNRLFSHLHKGASQCLCAQFDSALGLYGRVHALTCIDIDDWNFTRSPSSQSFQIFIVARRTARPLPSDAPGGTDPGTGACSHVSMTASVHRTRNFAIAPKQHWRHSAPS